MKAFKIIAIKHNQRHVITDYESYYEGRIEQSSTFDEELQEEENEKMTLSFSLSAFIYDRESGKLKRYRNKNVNLLPIGAEIQLHRDNRIYNFIITSITPEIKNESSIFKYVAQDEASFSWSKRNIGYSYSGEVPQTITEIATKIIVDNNWDMLLRVSVDESIANNKITFSVSNSNIYNAFLELSYLTNSNIEIRYESRTIYFKPKKDKTSLPSFRFLPKTNLREFSPTLDGEELVSILRVSGGENEFGQHISIVPPMPVALQSIILKDNLLEGNWQGIDAFWTTIKKKDIYKTDSEVKKYVDYVSKDVRSLNNFLYDFEYFERRGIITSTQHEELKNRIDDYIGKANIGINIYANKEMQLQWQIRKTEQEFEIEGQAALSCLRKGIKVEYDKSEALSILIDTEQIDLQLYNKHVSAIIENIKSKNYEYFYNLELLYGNLPQYENINRYKELAEYYTEESLKLERETNNLIVKYKEESEDGFVKTNYKAEIEANINRLITYKSLSENFFDEFEGLYSMIYTQLDDERNSYTPVLIAEDKSISYNLEHYKSISESHWKQIFFDYKQAIYEGYYENTDELDSEGLFKQAFGYFNDMKRPLINTTLSVIQMSEIIPMTKDIVKVGEKIIINYADLHFDKEDYKEDNYFHETLLVTGITQNLRSSEASLQVSQIKTTNNVLEQLLRELNK